MIVTRSHSLRNRMEWQDHQVSIAILLLHCRRSGTVGFGEDWRVRSHDQT
jgi:hypothetical protein